MSVPASPLPRRARRCCSAYLFAGLLVVMIMRMLAEMAVATPDTGSFSTYADKAIGRWAGYTIGWLYWWFWVLVIPLEANIAAIILQLVGAGRPGVVVLPGHHSRPHRQ